MTLRRAREALSGKGRRTCYEGWVRDYAEDLYRFAFRLSGDADNAEDLVQETFYHAWKDRGTLRSGAKARAWLFQILRNRYSHWVRSRLADPKKTVSIQAAGHLPALQRPAAESLAERELLQIGLDALPDQFKIPLLMVFVEGLTCREAAVRLDVPLGTVLSRIHRARRDLQAALVEDARHDSEVLKPRLRLGGEA